MSRTMTCVSLLDIQSHLQLKEATCLKECSLELNLNQCLYQIVGLNCGMVLKSILKVVAMYRYSRNVLKKSVYILMIKLADTIEYKLCEQCKTWYGVILTSLQKL